MIERNRFYSLAEVADLELLAGVVPMHDMRGVRNLIKTKRLKVIEMGKGLSKRYYIKGERLIEFIAKVEAGDIF